MLLHDGLGGLLAASGVMSWLEGPRHVWACFGVALLLYWDQPKGHGVPE